MWLSSSPKLSKDDEYGEGLNIELWGSLTMGTSFMWYCNAP